MSGEKFLEEALEKSDADLFKELFRLYPLAHVEDYYKAGWQNDLMKTDIQLFWAHREESGAPHPPAIEELELPTFPSVTDPKTTAPETTTTTTTTTTTPDTTPKTKVKEVRNIIVSPVLPQDETLEILIFVNKHGLDLTKTKVLLAPVERSRRGTLMADFSPGEDSCALAQLQDFMQKSGISFERLEDEATPLASTEATDEASPSAAVSESSPVATTAPAVEKTAALAELLAKMPPATPATPASASGWGPRPAGPLTPGPVTIPARPPSQPPVKTPPVAPPGTLAPTLKVPVAPAAPVAVPAKHVTVPVRAPMAPKPPVSKPMPSVLAAKLPTKRPFESSFEADPKRPHLMNVMPHRVPIPKLPPGMPIPSLPLRPRAPSSDWSWEWW
eukprot:symbB.v1.2.008807.t1/scaffold536.1/size343967/23